MARSRDDDFVSALRADFVRVLVEQTGASETYVIPMAAKLIGAMQLRYGGNEVYIRSSGYDEDAVMADFNYRNHDEVCRKHDISRRTLYRIVKSRTSARP